MVVVATVVAAVVATVLDLDEGPGVTLDALDLTVAGRVHGHHVADAELSAGTANAAVALGAELLLIAEDEIDLRHGGKILRLGLRGAA